MMLISGLNNRARYTALIPVPPVKGLVVALRVKSKLGNGTFHPGDPFRPPGALLN